MKTIIIVLLVGFSLQIANAQSGWYWQNPVPSGSNLESVYMVNNNIAFATGWDGTIIKTTNGGTNWIQQESGGNRFLLSTTFLDLNTGYIVSGDNSFSSNNVLLRTTNGGSNWDSIYTFWNTALNTICFLNGNTGFIGGYGYWYGGKIFKTTDGGYSWQNPGYFSLDYIHDICFPSNDIGYAGSEHGEVYKTTNCGDNWFALNAGFSFTVNSIYFFDSLKGIASGSNGMIRKTTNGGVGWTVLNSGVTTNLKKVTFINSDTGFIAGGKILRTTNGGSSWDTAGNKVAVWSGSMQQSGSGLMVGYNGCVYKTSNYGNTWDSAFSSKSSGTYNKIMFLDQITGYVFGYPGNILKTTNSGESWFKLLSNVLSNLKDASFPNSETGYAVGDSGTIIKTTNSGNLWIKLNSGTNADFTSINFVNSNIGYTSGTKVLGGYPASYDSKVLKTTDAGQSWSVKLNTDYYLYANYFLNEFTGFVSAQPTNGVGRLFRTTDGGTLWNQISLPTNGVYNSFYFLNNLTGFVGGLIFDTWGSYSLLKTTNAGINWDTIAVSPQYIFRINNIYFENNDIGYLAGISFNEYARAGELYKTIDGGLTWYHYSSTSILPTFQNKGMNSIAFINSYTGFVVGESGAILRTTNGGSPIGVTSIIAEIPNTFSLHQNYPNPFNPTTKIKFDIPAGVKGQTSNVKLIIYDILGREVATIVNEQLKPGTYEADWDASNFASGIYFYSLETELFSETKKMVLMK